ncbi:hypothetical protein KEM52_000065 [Ascosphaera acerosa]|nr:hypothetical protein KEM52_000065 [Ascosphaera acerosa]
MVPHRGAGKLEESADTEAFAELVLEASKVETFDNLEDPLDPAANDAAGAAEEESLNALSGSYGDTLHPLPLFGDDNAEELRTASPEEELLNASGADLIMVKATLGVGNKAAECKFLIDSGATGEYADSSLLKRIGVAVRTDERKTIQLPKGISIPAVGTATVVDDLGYDLILDRKWLATFNPSVDWRTGDITITSQKPPRRHHIRAIRPRQPEIDLESLNSLRLVSASQVKKTLRRPDAESILCIGVIDRRARRYD